MQPARPPSPRRAGRLVAALCGLALASAAPRAAAQEGLEAPAELAADAAGTLTKERADAKRRARLVEPRWVTPDQPEDYFVAAALRASRTHHAQGGAAFSEGIAGRGLVAVPAALEVLVRRRVPGVHEGELEQLLSVPQRDVLLAALAALEPRAVLSQARMRCEGSQDLGTRTAMIEVLGALGGADELEQLLAPALLLEETELADELRAALREALARLLARDERAFTRLAALLRRQRPQLVPPVLFALGDAGDERGLAILDEVLNFHPDQGQLAASQVPRIGRSLAPEVNRQLADRLHWMLDPARLGECRAAVLALGVLRDHEAVPALIGFLEGDHAGLRDTALWSLREMTGLAFAADATLWRRWHERELAWFRTDLRGIPARLRSGEPAVVVAALRDLGERRMRREELALEVLPVLERPEADLRALACATLARLDEPLVAPALVDLLEDQDAGAARAAAEALAALTGKDLPPERAAWSAALALEE